jgi:hypothetical protein
LAEPLRAGSHGQRNADCNDCLAPVSAELGVDKGLASSNRPADHKIFLKIPLFYLYIRPMLQVHDSSSSLRFLD